MNGRDLYALGETQWEIARKVGFTQATVSRWITRGVPFGWQALIERKFPRLGLKAELPRRRTKLRRLAVEIETVDT